VVNTGAWTADMLIPKWFEEEYGQDKACYGWHVEINNGECKLVPYGIHPKTKEERKNAESMKSKKEEQKENIVSKTASQVGGVVKQIVEVGSSTVKQDKSTKSSDDSEGTNS
jgi:hypothetical protein